MILAIEWEHEVRVLLRSNKGPGLAPLPSKNGGRDCPRTSDPFFVTIVPTSTEPGRLTRLRIVPFDRGGYMRLGVIGNQDRRSTWL